MFNKLKLLCIIASAMPLVNCHCTATGLVCNPGGGQSGICIPPDSNGDCYNIYGFVFDNGHICEDEHGPNYANV